MAIKAARKAMMNRRMAIAMAQRASRTRNAMIAAGGAGLLGVGAYMALRPRNASLSSPHGYPLYKTSAAAGAAEKVVRAAKPKGSNFMLPFMMGLGASTGIGRLLRPMKGVERIKMKALLENRNLQIADLLKKINRYEMIGGMAGAGLGGAGLAALLGSRPQAKTAAVYEDPHATQLSPQIDWKPFLPWIASSAAVGIGAGGLAKVIKAIRARSVAQELAMRRMKTMKQLGLLGAGTAFGLGAYALTNR